MAATEAQKAANKRYREKNKDKVNKKLKLWREKNKDKVKEADKNYRDRNKEALKAKAARYYQNNKDSIKVKSKESYQNNKDVHYKRNKEWKAANKDKVSASDARYYTKNKESRIEYISRYKRDRRKIDPQFDMVCRLRGRLSVIMRQYQAKKIISSVKDLGCTIPEFMIYLESLFTTGMTWDNRSEWHIDHIRPLSSFNLLDPEEAKKACHYTNLQPLWAIDNLKKGDKLVEDKE
jgi:hypothetical protein